MSRLVVHFGTVYRMSRRSYLRMLAAVAKGKESPTWEELGAKRVGRINCDTTDLGAREANYWLREDVNL